MERKAKPLCASNISRPSGIPQRTMASRKRTATDANGPSFDETAAPPSKRPNKSAVKTTSKTTAKTVSITRLPAVKTVGGTGKKTQQPTTSSGRVTVRGKGTDTSGAAGKKKNNPKAMDTEIIFTQMELLSSRVNKLEAEKVDTHHQASVNLHQHKELSDKVKSMEEQLSEARRQLSESEHRLELAEISKASLQRSHDQIETSLAGARQEISSLKSTLSQMVADASTVQCQLEAVKATRDKVIQESACKSERISELEQDIVELKSTLLDHLQKIRENESHRRKLHNTIQELKGNIRVFCRVRPLLSSEVGASTLDDSTASTDTTSSICSVGSQTTVKGDKGSLLIEFPDKERDCKKISIHFSPHKDDTSSKRSSRSQMHEFEYDYVFGPECSQEDVFSEISQLVQSALDGYNVCIFAYGQTGSGKTYTMEGPPHSEGMIPRALRQVFAASRDLCDKGWVYEMKATFIEIYNETLHDLLTNTKKDKTVKHDIKIDSKNQGEVYVTNITPIDITSEQQVTRLLEIAAKNRAVAATDCNERSSRSHCLFQLTLLGTNNKTNETCRGSLNLVDLAGSERLGSSGSGNGSERLKETQSINKSLSNLGNVIMALANKESHIPYRNSKLTYLLQNSLGGNSKTLMFVNLSPQPAALQETLCSLRFASKVNQCNIGTARKISKQ